MKRSLPSVNNQQVKVYRNLQAKCLSVMEKGLITGHAQTVRLTDVKFQVSQAGRDRCLQRQRKTVHAFVVGKLQEAVAEVLEPTGTKVSYNPYKMGCFYNSATGETVHEAKAVIITPNGVFVEE